MFFYVPLFSSFAACMHAGILSPLQVNIFVIISKTIASKSGGLQGF